MSINFMNKDFLPKIVADKVSCDGYEVTNLLLRHSPGFLAESFIKPPVTITIKFPFNISISQVVINGKVGGQRSTGFEIYTATFRRKTCWLFNDSADDDVATTFDDKVFLRVGRGYSKNPDSCQFMFVARQSSEDSVSSHNSLTFPLSNHFEKHLSSVSALAVRVTSTNNGSAVAVRSVEVWGNPAKDTPNGVIAQLNLLNKRKHEMIGSPPAKAGIEALARCETISENMTVNPAADIPNEFLDAITHELMSLPILLPCGQTIDQTTLDRYIKEEAVWGRAPSDPFTASAFTSQSRPVQNTYLKIRLDEFVLKHNHNWHSGTLGRSNGVSNRQCSRLVKRPSEITLRTADETVPIRNSKRMKLDPGLEPRCEAVSTSHHEDKLTTSLDCALKEALSNLPSFTKSKNDEISAGSQQTTGCSSCGTETEEHMYQFKCGHNICRQCLLSIMKEADQSTCKICGSAVHGHEVTKIHLSKSDFLLQQFS